MRIDVDVMQGDLDEGTPCSPCCCPVALALRRALGRDVAVGAHAVEVLNGALVPVCDLALPHTAQRWIAGYDNTLSRPEMAPFKFMIEVPEAVA